MKKSYFFAGVFLTASLAGCVSAPDKSELAKANYGELPENYQQQVKVTVGSRLKDPYSAVYDFKNPFKGWCKSGFTTMYGWVIPFTLNAKNSYGAYAGASPKTFMFYKGNLVDVTPSSSVGGCGQS